MSEDLLETLIQWLKAAGKFSLQIDETTDISKHAKLLAVVRFVDGDSVNEITCFVWNNLKEIPVMKFFESQMSFLSNMELNGKTFIVFALTERLRWLGTLKVSLTILKPKTQQ